MNLFKQIHDLCVEDDGKPAPSKSVAIPSTPSTDFNFNASTLNAPSPFSVPGNTVLDEAVYQRVLSKTDFDKTDVGTKLHRYYDALPDVLDTNTKFKTALAQVSKLDGITADQVLGAFDDLKLALKTETEKFADAANSQTQKEVDSRKQRLQQLSTTASELAHQIEQINQEAAQIGGELAEAQGKIANAQTQFQLAFTRRNSEIDQQRAQFTMLLK